MRTLVSFSLLFFLPLLGFAQFEWPVFLPEASPKAAVEQTIGLTRLRVDYHSPAVKGREVWGALIPYGQIWRAGANENTVFHCADTLEIGGQVLPAGKYGVHVLPEKENWTFIFSKNHTSWGSYFYEGQEDALRIKVPVQEVAHKEWLNYHFEGHSEDSTLLTLHWGNRLAQLPIHVNTEKHVIRDIRKQLRSRPYWGWTGLSMAARYCAERNINTEEALGWAERSIQLNKNFTNLIVKASLLKNLGKTEEAKATEQEALSLASGTELNNHAYGLMNAKDYGQAKEFLEASVEKFPEIWYAHFALGQIAAEKGDTESAKKHYQVALEKAPESRKALVNSAIEALGE